jgi:uncharacterized membrane protein YgcG
MTAVIVVWVLMTSAPFGSLNVQSSASMLGCPWTTCDQVLREGGGVLRVCGGDGNGGSSSGNSGRVSGIISA